MGSGPNSTTLHYNADDRFIEAGDVIVMDIGASFHGYAADVTRTVPASGTGDYVFNGIWTLLHVPCVNVPGFYGPTGMPIGVTLTGPRFSDRVVIAAAAALGKACSVPTAP